MPIQSVLNKGKVPVKIWIPMQDIESAALTQLSNMANLPFLFKHIAAMPDAHMGNGACVGSVVATKDAIMPAAVGVDIGCGMCAVKTDLNMNQIMDKLPKIRASIERSIPLGMDYNRKITTNVKNWNGWANWSSLTKGDDALKQRAMSQLGSLGGGNHFIEICLDSDNNVWVMLHSGSRNVGKTVAERHINDAKRLMSEKHISNEELPDRELAYFVAQDMEFQNYIKDVQWCQDYAAQNRVEMMNRVMKDISHAVGMGGAPIGRLLEVNCHHNYIAHEFHFGEEVLVTRKGAVKAALGDLGIIPGSMGAKSYIVKGLGNADSFCSCSHGAGRRMSRGEAKRTFTLDDLAKQTAGIECRKDEGVIDEIPSAYKDIDVVMANQSDLVEVVATLKQVMCVKG